MPPETASRGTQGFNLPGRYLSLRAVQIVSVSSSPSPSAGLSHLGHFSAFRPESQSELTGVWILIIRESLCRRNQFLLRESQAG
jgi:hypothetical protein